MGGDWGSDLCTGDLLGAAGVAMGGKGCAALYRGEETWSCLQPIFSCFSHPTTHMALHLLGLGLHASPGCGTAVSWRYPVIMLLTFGIGHYYRTGYCSRPFVPAAFRPGTKGGFCPGSNG